MEAMLEAAQQRLTAVETEHQEAAARRDGSDKSCCSRPRDWRQRMHARSRHPCCRVDVKLQRCNSSLYLYTSHVVFFGGGFPPFGQLRTYYNFYVGVKEPAAWPRMT